MIRRTMDAVLLNRVMNDPSVRPHIFAGEGDIDVTSVVENPDNVALVTEHGGFLLIKHEPGVYEVHTQFLPEGRGKHAVQAMREGFRYMFTRTDCLEILTKVASNNSASDGFAKLAGFKERFTRPNAWNRQALSYRAVTLEEWTMRDPVCERIGNATWHEAFRIDMQGFIHQDDKALDCHLGAFQMMLEDQPAKAAWFYNKWARFSGYATVDLDSHAPFVVHVRDAIINLGENLHQHTKRAASCH